MKKSVVNTTLGLIALATMSFAASHAQANHDDSRRYDAPYDHTWQEREFGYRHEHRSNRQRLAEINTRQTRLEDRIERGWENGALTRREYRTLKAELRHFEWAKRDLMSDGSLTSLEFQQLENGLDNAARNIRSQMRDEETRFSHYENSRYGHRWGNYR